MFQTSGILSHSWQPDIYRRMTSYTGIWRSYDPKCHALSYGGIFLSYASIYVFSKYMTVMYRHILFPIPKSTWRHMTVQVLRSLSRYMMDHDRHMTVSDEKSALLLVMNTVVLGTRPVVMLSSLVHACSSCLALFPDSLLTGICLLILLSFVLGWPSWMRHICCARKAR